MLTPAVFDQLRLAMTASPVALAELYRDYLADAWESLQVLRESVQRGEVETVRAKAHYLRSSSLVLGAHVVARYAAMLEEGAGTSDSQESGDLLGELARSLQEVQKELAVRLGSGVIPANEPAA